MPWQKFTDSQFESDRLIALLTLTAIYHSYFLAHYHGDESSFLYDSAILLLALIVVITVGYFTLTRPKVILLFVFLVSIPFGCHFFSINHNSPFPWVKLDAELEMKVLKDSRLQSWGSQSTVAVTSVITCPTNNRVICEQLIGKTLSLNDYGRRVLLAGQSVKSNVRLKPYIGFRNPGGFDYSLWAYSKRFFAKGYFKGELSVLDTKFSSGWADQLYRRINQIDDESLTSGESRGLLMALMLADKSLLVPETRRLLIESGLIHLFVISGLHIGLLFLSLCWFFRGSLLCISSTLRINLSGNSIGRFQWLISCVALLITGLYVVEIEMPMPALRALIFLLVWQCCRLCNWHLSIFQVLGISVWLLLSVFPEQLFMSGFWMSIVAVFAIGLAMIKPSLSSGIKGPLFSLLRVQFYIVMALLPFSLWFGSSVSVFSFVFNLIFIPVFSFIVMPLLVVAGLLFAIIPDIYPIIEIVGLGLVSLLAVIDGVMNDFPLSMNDALVVPNVLIFLPLLMLLLPVSRIFRLIGVSLVAIALLVWPQQKSDMELWFLDVGQGLAVVLIQEQRAIVYDTGFSIGSFNAFDSVIKPFLRAKNIRGVDLLIVSHGDMDHRGGLVEFMKSTKFKPKKLIVSGFSPQSMGPYALCSDRLQVSWFDLQIKGLWPIKGHAMNDDISSNDSSCVVLVEYQEQGILLTGDISQQVEAEIMKHYPEGLGQVSVLSVPHHGSKSSSGNQFIQYLWGGEVLDSQHAVVSSGPLNRFSHPHESVVKRYLEANTQLYNTAEKGAIGFVWSENSLEPMMKSHQTGFTPYWKTLFPKE